MKITIFILLLFVQFDSSAQNLIPNPSFEQYVDCPVGHTQNWFYLGPNDWVCSRGTPDYFNSCWTSGINNVDVPYNSQGHQFASEGQGYMGIIGYDSTSVLWQEAIGTTLSQPLQIGTEYYVSFKVSYAETFTNYAINKIGLRFSNELYNLIDDGTMAPIDNIAHIYTDSIITETSSWVTISGSFIADSAYEYVMIGNFFHPDSVDIQLTSLFGNNQQVYYYIDEVCVSTSPFTCANNNVGLSELPKSEKHLIKIVDSMGRETENKPNSLLIYIYSDGTTEKVFRAE
jgi:hypothetical protein